MDRRSFLAAGIVAAEAFRPPSSDHIIEQLGFGARQTKVDWERMLRLSKAAHFTLFEPGISPALIVNQIVDPAKGARMEMPAWVFAR